MDGRVPRSVLPSNINIELRSMNNDHIYNGYDKMVPGLETLDLRFRKLLHGCAMRPVEACFCRSVWCSAVRCDATAVIVGMIILIIDS